MIALTLSDRLPCCNHPGYSQERGCAPHEYFQCDRCLRIVPYCRGCWDELLDSCDDCWAKVRLEEVES